MPSTIPGHWKFQDPNISKLLSRLKKTRDHFLHQLFSPSFTGSVSWYRSGHFQILFRGQEIGTATSPPISVQPQSSALVAANSTVRRCGEPGKITWLHLYIYTVYIKNVYNQVGRFYIVNSRVLDFSYTLFWKFSDFSGLSLWDWCVFNSPLWRDARSLGWFFLLVAYDFAYDVCVCLCNIIILDVHLFAYVCVIIYFYESYSWQRRCKMTVKDKDVSKTNRVMMRKGSYCHRK